ncbi:MAG: TetR/AcrR family transcriptional regulator [Thiotrichales bacterium]|nr:TetR/AcrR family transcriptional regulator [Thiotrichales bacterium]
MQSAMCLFRADGFENTTMEAIAEAADVAKRTLYSYFPAKESLVSAYWLNNVRQNNDLLPLLFKNYPDTRSRLTAVFLSAAKGFKAEPEFARIHFSYQFQQIGNSKQPLPRSDFVQFLSVVIETGQREKDLRKDIVVTELATQVMLNFTATCLMWFSGSEVFSLDERLTYTVDCFIDGAGINRK